MLRKMRSGEFDGVYGIMESSFPADEIRPYGEQKERLSRENYVIYVTPSKNGRVGAFITAYDFPGFAFVEHFAVAEDFRGGGIGSRILGELKETVKKRICLEVEPPETETAKRRIAFYERNGFTLNRYPYTQPPISAGRNAIPLMIMTTDGAVTEEEFCAMKKTLHREVYGSENFG
mgnify:FL=1